MSSELERRLEAMLADAPEPDPGAGEKALHRALRALQPAAPAHRGLRTAVLVFAPVVVLLVVAAGSLAAAGALHVSFGAKAKPRPAAVQLTLPRGADGIAAIVDGRLAVVTKGGFRLQGLPVSDAALSPHALFVAAGVGNSLVAMAPNGRRAWSHPAGGKVVAIAWAPDGYRIAYVVHAGRRYALHLIYGNGIHDMTVDRSVRAVQPSWRADSLAFAYVGGGGRAVVYDLGHKTHRVVGKASPVTHVAFAPTGTTLAVATPSSVLVGRKTVATDEVGALGWLRGRLAVVTPALESGRMRVFSPTGVAQGSASVHGIVLAVTPKLVIVRHGTMLVAGHTTLLTVPPSAAVSDLQVG
jgi:hypothetical protein